MARKGLPWISQRILSRKKRLDREIFWAMIGCLLYLIVSRFNNQILYLGSSNESIYIPIIIIGVIVLSRQKNTTKHFVVYWFFRFVLSFSLFYVPAMCLFVIGNHLYTRNSHPKTKIIQHVENHGTVVIFELAGERVKYRGEITTTYLNNNQSHKNFSGKLIYNEGLLGTYIVDRFVLIEIE